MIDNAPRANWSAATIGLTATVLILWLATSFWLEARDQRTDAANVLAVNTVETRLLNSAADISAARLSLIADTTPLAISDSTADLADTLRATNDLLADSRFNSKFHFSTPALKVLVDQASDTTSNWKTARQELNLAQGSIEAEFSARVNVFEYASQLVKQLHDIQGGLRYLPGAEIEKIPDLRAFRAGIRDLSEKISAEHATQVMSTLGYQQQLPEFTSSWQVSWQQVQQLLISLQSSHQWQDPDSSLLGQLDGLTQQWLLSRSEQSISPPGKEQVLELDTQMQVQLQRTMESVDEMIRSRATASKSHGSRRLIIDSLLIAIAVWIVFASMRLVSKIRHQAYHDRLTNLPNRFRLEKLLADAVAKGQSDGSSLAVAVLDIDNFKLVNNSFGHALGNELLVLLAERLQQELGSQGKLARLSADEFAVLMQNENQAKAVVEYLMAKSARPFDIRGVSINISISAGLYLVDGSMPEPQVLITNAELAMHRAKSVGKNCLVTFDPDLGEQYRARIEMEVDLHRAVKSNQLLLHYQPKVNTATGLVDGVEALLRWQHPQSGLVPPFKFIPIAEECGLIVDIGTWVLQEACRQNALWRQQGIELQVAINVSAEQFAQDDFVELVQQALDQHQLSADSIELEVTESVGVEGSRFVVDRLNALRALSISVAIDDFGTGYSSLQYLDDLPLDKLKIDRAFICKIDAPDESDSLVSAVMSLANTYGLQTVAEGVETEAQLERVIKLGCDYIQGYYHSRPVAAQDIPATIERINKLGGMWQQQAA